MRVEERQEVSRRLKTECGGREHAGGGPGADVVMTRSKGEEVTEDLENGREGTEEEHTYSNFSDCRVNTPDGTGPDKPHPTRFLEG